MRTAIDTNIISALWTKEANVSAVIRQLQLARESGGLVICPIVYIELCAYPRVRVEDVKRFLKETRIDFDDEVPRKVWELAAEAYAQYASRRRESRDGSPKRMPADFIIAAHASLRADRLLTLDQRRYQTDFPELALVEC